MLSKNNPRIVELTELTKKEEELGLFNKEHISYIGRLKFWNQLCFEKNAKDSISSAPILDFPIPTQLCLLSEDDVIIRRENTAIARTKPSSPTCWAEKNGYIKSSVFDWGCGKGMDSKWLKNTGYDVIRPILQAVAPPRQNRF